LGRRAGGNFALALRSSLVDRALDLPRPAKRAVALAVDSLTCLGSVQLAFYLRLGYWPRIAEGPMHPMIVSIILALPIFVSFGLYRAIFRYAGAEAIVSITRAVAVYAVPFALIYTVVGVANVPRTVGLIQPLLLFLLIVATRTGARLLFEDSYTVRRQESALPRVMIYGAGGAGRELAAAIISSRQMRLLGFVDDNQKLWGVTLRGVPILAPSQLEAAVHQWAVSDILLATPSATRARRAEIVQQLRELKVHVRTLPGIMDMARGAVSMKDLRDVEIEDLLGRAPVPPDRELLKRNISGKVVLVTGAGGSIGSELCRQIAEAGPAKLILVESSEFNLYSIHQELVRSMEARSDAPTEVIQILASAADEARMREVLATWRPQTIFHAAAYKHVPLVEHNAVVGIRNNVFGTLTMARLAQEQGCANFVLISTDKAVRPTNIMGASKRLAEMVLQALQAEGGPTNFSMVRFGNVLGSSGSVVPLFRSQIAAGGPITITDPEITRYFMTIPEAAQLVLQAGAMAEGGEVFLLDMGEPVKIVDLARNIVELSGLSVRDEQSPDGDIEIRFVGLRPGEKLYEELLIGETPLPTGHSRIFCSREAFLSWPELSRRLDALGQALDAGDAGQARTIAQELVPEYAPSSPLVDLVSCARAEMPEKPKRRRA